LILSTSSSTVRQQGTACEDENQLEGNVEVGLGFVIKGGATYEIKSDVEGEHESEIENDAEREVEGGVEVEGESDAKVEVVDKLYNKAIHCAHLFI
jgi:hypothetical protein